MFRWYLPAYLFQVEEKSEKKKFVCTTNTQVQKYLQVDEWVEEGEYCEGYKVHEYQVAPIDVDLNSIIIKVTKEHLYLVLQILDK